MKAPQYQRQRSARAWHCLHHQGLTETEPQTDPSPSWCSYRPLCPTLSHHNAQTGTADMGKQHVNSIYSWHVASLAIACVQSATDHSDSLHFNTAYVASCLSYTNHQVSIRCLVEESSTASDLSWRSEGRSNTVCGWPGELLYINRSTMICGNTTHSAASASI